MSAARDYMDVVSYSHLVEEHARIEEAVRHELVTLVDELMDMDEMPYAAKGVSCFTDSDRAASQYSNWSSDLKVFPEQWQRIQKILRSNDPLNMQFRKLERIKDTSRLRLEENGQRYTIQFAPAIVERLKLIMTGGGYDDEKHEEEQTNPANLRRM